MMANATSWLRVLRYAGVSVMNVLTGQTLLYVFYAQMNLPSGVSNVASVVLSMIPAYYFSKRWVWQQSSDRTFGPDAAAFFGLTAVGLILSTVAVVVVTSVWSSELAANAASLSAFGVVWAAKFVILERVIWPTDPAPAAVGVGVK